MSSCHAGVGGLWLSHLAMSEIRNSQVRFGLRWPGQTVMGSWPPADTL